VGELSQKSGKKPLRPGSFYRFRQQNVEMYNSGGNDILENMSRIFKKVNYE